MIIAVLIVLGLCFGSFINALVWRLHQQSLPKTKQAAKTADLSITKGRSMCPDCQHALGALDLLPLVSWIMLRGRCRYCKHPISWQYPLVEALLATLYIVSYVFWPFALQGEGLFLFAGWLIALIGLIALLVYDLHWMLLPNKIVFPLIALGAGQVAVSTTVYGGGWTYLIQALLSVAIAGGVFFVLYQVSKGSWIGGGDVKLGYALGLILVQPTLAVLMIFTASLLGTLAALPSIITKKLGVGSRIPFGPFLIVATVIVMLFGRVIVDWYTGQIV